MCPNYDGESANSAQRYCEPVVDDNGGKRDVRLTRRGAATRAAIVMAAAELMYVHGVASTSVDEVRAASSVSKSQFYRHFNDKAELVHAVIALRAEQTLTRQGERLRDVDSMSGLQEWGEAFTRRSVLRRGAWGCELGSLAAELADSDEPARARLAHHFDQWETLLAGTFQRMLEAGTLRHDTEPKRLAVAVMAAIQGGYLLAQTAQDSAPMSIAIAMALDHVRTHAPS